MKKKELLAKFGVETFEREGCACRCHLCGGDAMLGVDGSGRIVFACPMGGCSGEDVLAKVGVDPGAVVEDWPLADTVWPDGAGGPRFRHVVYPGGKDRWFGWDSIREGWKAAKIADVERFAGVFVPEGCGPWSAGTDVLVVGSEGAAVALVAGGMAAVCLAGDPAKCRLDALAGCGRVVVVCADRVAGVLLAGAIAARGFVAGWKSSVEAVEVEAVAALEQAKGGPSAPPSGGVKPVKNQKSTLLPAKWKPCLKESVAVNIEDGILAFQRDNKTDKGELPKLDRGTVLELTAEVILLYLGARGKFYFHEVNRDFASVMWFDATEKILHMITRDEFQSWLARESGINRSTAQWRFIYSAVEDEGLNGAGSVGITPAVMWARKDGCIYISCGDGEVVRCGMGVAVKVDNGTDGVVFLRGKTLRKWNLSASPKDPFAVCSLFRDMEVLETDKHAKLLAKLWFLSLFYCHHAKVPALFVGEPGSGKTRFCRGFFELLGIQDRIVGVDARNGEESFWASVSEGGLVCMDNVDQRMRWFQDAIAAYSTGGTREARKKYSDFETARAVNASQMAVTSANPTFAADPAVADRMMVVRLWRNNSKETKDSEFTREIERFRDDCLTWVARALSAALADSKEVARGINFRHPDFAEFALRLGRAIGCYEESVACLRAAEGLKSQIQLESDYIGRFIVRFMSENECFSGYSSDVFKVFSEMFGGEFDSDMWSPTKIGICLDKLSRSIASLYDYSKVKDNHKTRYIIKRKHGGGGGPGGGFLETSHREFKCIDSSQQGPSKPSTPSVTEVKAEEL